MQVAARARHGTNSFDIGPLVLTVGYRTWLPSSSDLIRPSNSSLGEAMIIFVGVVDRQHVRPSTFLATIDRNLGCCHNYTPNLLLLQHSTCSAIHPRPATASLPYRLSLVQISGLSSSIRSISAKVAGMLAPNIHH